MNVFRKVLLVIFFGLIFLYSFNQIANSDTFYDIKTGQYIVNNFFTLHSFSLKNLGGLIPTHDIFSLPAYGAEWVPHEWLAQVIFYLVYAAGGFSGLAVFSALLGVLAYFILWRLALKKRTNFYLSILLLFVLSYLTLELWVPRPQIFSYLSFAALIYLLENYRDKPDKKYLWGSVLTIWFWANTNASFILGLVIICFYLFSETINVRWRKWSGKNLSSEDIKNLGIAAVCSIALSVFATPAGYKGFLYGFYVQGVADSLAVLEWKPITIFLYELQAQIFVAMIFLTDAIFVAWWFFFKKESRDMTFLGLVLGISLLPFISIRHVGFWPIAAFAPVAIALSDLLKSFLAKFSEKALVVFLLVLGIILIFGRLFWMPRNIINENIIPVSAVDFVKENNLRGPFFNLYNEGGYLIFRLWPEKVFMDGRSEVYRGRPLGEFLTVLGLHPGWDKLADDKYHINYFFLDSYYNPSLRRFSEPMAKALLNKNFRLVYWDDLTVIFVRDVPENKAIIGKYGLKYVNPFLEPADISAKDSKAAAAEIRTLLDRFPQSLFIQNYAARFLNTRQR